jgi:two-component system LytT family response regulator
MAPLRALLVDDERLARSELRRLLAVHPEIEVAGEAASVAEAVEQVTALDPDVVFLDIQMPGASGFELLERVEPGFQVVFVTAFDAHAVRAFEVNALDYLLKPVSPERLERAVGRVLRRAESPGQQEGQGGQGAGREGADGTARADDAGDPDGAIPPGGERPLELDDHLFVAGERRAGFVKVGAIACILGAGDYSELVLPDGQRHLILRPLKEWERRLPEKQFVRIHRASIVNLEHVERVERDRIESFVLHVRGVPEPLRMSRRHAARLKLKMF